MASKVAKKCQINVSFSGCGFLGMYHLGALTRFKECQMFKKTPFEINSALGASAGALGKTFKVCPSQK
jgi:predicted acylesterase/phospholipase RssA